MDKKMISIILMISLIFGLAAPTLGEGEEVPEGSLPEIEFKLDKDTYNLDEYITGTGKLKLNDKGVKWSSSDEGIAKVNSAGVVAGIEKGTAVITAVVGTINLLQSKMLRGHKQLL